MAQFEAYNKILVSENEGIRNISVNNNVLGFELYCQYPSYRGTYLSCIEDFELYVDGEQMPEETIQFWINGKNFLISELKDLFSEYWFILDKAKLRIFKEGGVEEKDHNVKINMRHKIPYTGYFGDYLILNSSDTKELKFVKGGKIDE